MFDCCRNAKRPECRTTRLTTISHCRVIVSRMPTMQHCGHMLLFSVVGILSWHARMFTQHTSVRRYHGPTMEPRYFFFTVPVLSRSRYYRSAAIPLIPWYYRTVLANKESFQRRFLYDKNRVNKLEVFKNYM